MHKTVRATYKHSKLVAIKYRNDDGGFVEYIRTPDIGKQTSVTLNKVHGSFSKKELNHIESVVESLPIVKEVVE